MKFSPGKQCIALIFEFDDPTTAWGKNYNQWFGFVAKFHVLMAFNIDFSKSLVIYCGNNYTPRIEYILSTINRNGCVNIFL